MTNERKSPRPLQDNPFEAGLSVVIPFYGDPEPTIDLIESLHRQIGAPTLQIIVSDDCSPTPFPTGDGYEVVRRNTNGGFGTNVNTGMKRAEHDYALILNSDLELEPTSIRDWCHASLPWLPAVTAPAMKNGDGHLAHVPWHFHRPHHLVAEWLRPLARFHDKDWYGRLAGHDMDAFNSKNPSVTGWLIGAALLVPVAEFRAVGGFDERFFMNAEEVDLQHRLKLERGIPAVYLPQVVLTHFGAGSSASERRLGWVLDSRYKLLGKWGGRRRLHAGLCAATGINFVWNGARFLLGKDDDPRLAFKRDVKVMKHAWNESK